MMDAASPMQPRTPTISTVRRAFVLLAMFLLVLTLAGCAGMRTDETATEAPAEREQREPMSGEGTVRHEVDNRAVAMLWDEAEQARREGELESAVSSLERAVKLAPEDPVLWSRLSELRFRQERFAEAENLAAKSNSLAGDRRLLRFRNWLLIAEARAQRGDAEGAEQARAEARRLRGDGAGE
jgi:predicted Zn-dependent protease